MSTYYFTVEFLSDVVLSASSNTQGAMKTLEYIPGSNFLGMVARNYTDFDDAFSVFHTSKVRFNDAHILYENSLTYKVPFSLYHEKLNKSSYFNHHLIDEFKRFKQLKQKRDGFMTLDCDLVSLSYTYAQKSSYDKAKRTSKKGGMFGYMALPKGLSGTLVLVSMRAFQMLILSVLSIRLQKVSA